MLIRTTKITNDLVLRHKIQFNNPYLIIFCVSIFSAIFCFHPSLNYNSDAKISSVGLIIANTISENSFQFHSLLPGFKANGGFTKYLHWPPLSYWMLGLWLKLVSNTFLSARVFMVIIKICTDLVFVKYLKTLKINQTQLVLISIIFCLIPFRLIYIDLIFGDSFVFLFIFSALYFEHNQKNIQLSIVAILGILTSWYFGVFVAGFCAYKFLKKDFSKPLIILVVSILTAIIIWLIYIKINSTQSITTTHPLPQKIKGLNFSYLNQMYSYSFMNVLNGNTAFLQFLKWLIKFSAEVLVIFIALLSVKYDIRKLISENLKSIYLGFLLLFILLPFLYIIHNHNIYFLSFGVALFLSTKTKVEFNYLTIFILPVMYLLICFFEFQFKETKLRDVYILTEISKNNIKTIFINNPNYLQINQQTICTPWYLMYKSKAMVYERMSKNTSINDFIRSKTQKNEKYLIISSVPINDYNKYFTYYNGIYTYILTK